MSKALQNFTEAFLFQKMMKDISADPPDPDFGVKTSDFNFVTYDYATSHEALRNQGYVDDKGVVQVMHYQALGKPVAQMRWNMAKGFASAIAAQPAGHLKKIQGDEAHEVVDPKHRFGALTEIMEAFYRKSSPVIGHWKKSMFYAWLDELCRNQPQDVINFLLKEWGESNRQIIENFVKGGVTYLNTKKKRFTYQLTFAGGKLFQNGVPFDTSKSVTAHSGAGWAIYVASPSSQWFASSHKTGSFHHSSFLSGKPVLSAGEIQAQQGFPKILTAKSGHYQPNMEQFYNGVKSLRQAGINLDSCKVMLFEKQSKQEEQEKRPKQQVLIGAIPFLMNKNIQLQYTHW